MNKNCRPISVPYPLLKQSEIPCQYPNIINTKLLNQPKQLPIRTQDQKIPTNTTQFQSIIHKITENKSPIIQNNHKKKTYQPQVQQNSSSSPIDRKKFRMKPQPLIQVAQKSVPYQALFSGNKKQQVVNPHFSLDTSKVNQDKNVHKVQFGQQINNNQITLDLQNKQIYQKITEIEYPKQQSTAKNVSNFSNIARTFVKKKQEYQPVEQQFPKQSNSKILEQCVENKRQINDGLDKKKKFKLINNIQKRLKSSVRIRDQENQCTIYDQNQQYQLAQLLKKNKQQYNVKNTPCSEKNKIVESQNQPNDVDSKYMPNLEKNEQQIKNLQQIEQQTKIQISPPKNNQDNKAIKKENLEQQLNGQLNNLQYAKPLKKVEFQAFPIQKPFFKEQKEQDRNIQFIEQQKNKINIDGNINRENQTEKTQLQKINDLSSQNDVQLQKVNDQIKSNQEQKELISQNIEYKKGTSNPLDQPKQIEPLQLSFPQYRYSIIYELNIRPQLIPLTKYYII